MSNFCRLRRSPSRNPRNRARPIFIARSVFSFSCIAVAIHVRTQRHGDAQMGEIEMVGVDPDFQGRGIGGVNGDRDGGDGGDPGHGPARRAYEKAGLMKRLGFSLIDDN